MLANQDDYSANLTGVLIRGEDGEPTLFDLSQFGGTVDAIANADEPSHSLHRRLVMPQLTARKVGELEQEVQDWARRGVNTLLANGGGDCVGDLANAIPVMVTARLLGLPVEDVDKLLAWAFSGGEILAGVHRLEAMVDIGLATRAMSEYLATHLAAAMSKTPDKALNILDELARGVRAGQIDERAAVGILVVLVGAAGESTSSLIGSGIRMLAESAELQDRLRAEPGLLPAFIEEVVRLEAPFKGHYRVVRNDTELGGVQLPAQSRVFLMWAAANRDPAVFANPDALDLARADGSEHLGFGHGIHFCIGARLARMEARVVFEELLAATGSITLDPAHPPRHLQSIFVRRLPRLVLRTTPPQA
ncbi:MAG: cytochrome P450 [Halioglobus sp.]|nr:cytochrome P450 [Halioglobus sp.]